MPYFHDEAARAVYAVPEDPIVFSAKGGGWTVWVEIEITRADNYLDATGHWAYPVLSVPRDQYASRDTKDAAVGFFRNHHMTGFGKLIGKGEYDILRAKYDAEARTNKPPNAK